VVHSAVVIFARVQPEVNDNTDLIEVKDNLFTLLHYCGNINDSSNQVLQSELWVYSRHFNAV